MFRVLDRLLAKDAAAMRALLVDYDVDESGSFSHEEISGKLTVQSRFAETTWFG